MIRNGEYSIKLLRNLYTNKFVFSQIRKNRKIDTNIRYTNAYYQNNLFLSYNRTTRTLKPFKSLISVGTLSLRTHSILQGLKSNSPVTNQEKI
jgi:hypothetical protein